MSKRKLSNVNINNTHPINKKIKIESYDANKHKINIDFIKPHDDYDKWNVIMESIRDLFNDVRENIKKKYESEDFSNKNNIDKRIYYGGDIGNQAFQEMFQFVIKPEILIFMRIIKRTIAGNSHLPLSKLSICHFLLKLVGLERNVIAELTKTHKAEEFGIMSCDSKIYHYIHDEISVWPKWHDAFLKKLKNIFETYSCSENQPLIASDSQLKYLLVNKKNPKKIVTFFVDHISQNEYKCRLLAGDKLTMDHKNANLSSVVFSWTFDANSIYDVYQETFDNIAKYDNLIDVDKLKLPINPYCNHMAYYEPHSKIFDPLYSAITWNKMTDNTNDLKMYLGQFYWQISHSTTYFRGQSAISNWIIKTIFESFAFYNLSYFTGDITNDQFALLCLFENDFVDDFVDKIRLIM